MRVSDHWHDITYLLPPIHLYHLTSIHNMTMMTYYGWSVRRCKKWNAEF